MRKVFEIMITALLSSWITLGIVYIINPSFLSQPLETQVITQESPDDDVRVLVNNNFENVNKNFSFLQDQINNVEDDLKLLKEVVRNSQDSNDVVVQGPKGEPGEVPQEYLNKIDELIFKLDIQEKCLYSLYEFYISQYHPWKTRRYVDIRNDGRGGYVDIGYKVQDVQFLTEEVLRNQFNC
jgi:hypothetical protein